MSQMECRRCRAVFVLLTVWRIVGVRSIPNPSTARAVWHQGLPALPSELPTFRRSLVSIELFATLCTVFAMRLGWLHAAVSLCYPGNAAVHHLQPAENTISCNSYVLQAAEGSPTPAPAPTALSHLQSVSVAQRNTTGGTACRLPVYNG